MPPAWVPFRRFIGYWGSVILGRWIGGLLGYKPFFREYTTDWDYAVAKMKGSWFQRHMVEEACTKAKSWEEQVLLDKGKPLNAEYEPWVVDLSEQAGGHRENLDSHASAVGDSGVPVVVNGHGGGVNGIKSRAPRKTMVE